MPRQHVKSAPGVNGHIARSATDPNRGNKAVGPGVSGGGRTRATVNRLNMYRKKAYVRNRDGQILKDKGDFTSNVPEVGAGLIAPNRRWFGNTRTVSQADLQRFQAAVGDVNADPRKLLLKRKALPMSLIRDESDPATATTININTQANTSLTVKDGAKLHLLQVEPFQETFSKSRRRKKPKLAEHVGDSLTSLVQRANQQNQEFQDKIDADALLPDGTDPQVHQLKDANKEKVFDKGQSKRIWGELHRVIDSSDVVLQVIDARDPMGTRCLWLERFIQRECPHRHVVLILNKCDLVPTWVTARWLAVLSKQYPTLAFHANFKHPFGKGALINLLRQFKKLHQEKKSISCGIVGYPNVGKSSVINTLRGEKVVNVAPIPGETKVWQYVNLFKQIFLIDCPGVVHESAENTEADAILKGIVRIESLRDKAPQYIPDLMKRVDPQHIARTYGIDSWKDADDFLEIMARKTGKLLKKGEPDVVMCARTLLHDFQKGKLPWFAQPPPPPHSGTTPQEPEDVPQSTVTPSSKKSKKDSKKRNHKGRGHDEDRNTNNDYDNDDNDNGGGGGGGESQLIKNNISKDLKIAAQNLDELKVAKFIESENALWHNRDEISQSENVDDDDEQDDDDIGNWNQALQKTKM